MEWEGTRMKTRFKVLLWIFISVLLYFLFLGSKMSHLDRAEKTISLLMEMREEDSLLNEAILKNRNAIQKNYDSVQKSSLFIENSILYFDDFSYKLPNEDSIRLKKLLETVKLNFEAKKEKIEEFKEKNSIYTHSLSVIPISVRKLTIKYTNLKEQLDSLLKYILLYNIKTDEKYYNGAFEIIQKIKSNNISKENLEIEVFLEHSIFILNNKKQLDSIINEIIESKFADSIEKMGEDLSDIYIIILKKSGIYSVLLYSLSVGVLFYSAFILLKLIISSYSLKKAMINLKELNTSLERFVPRESLQLLSLDSINTIKLGLSVKREMTVLFSDIRSFTTISEKMSPEENFEFINSYLKEMGPIVRQHNGFIDKFIGDAIMALFRGEGEDALHAGIEMFKKLKTYNEKNRNTSKRPPLEIGIGIHSGEMMFGTIGENNRMETTVISDTVNLASRIESITKFYGVGFLISEHFYESIDYPNKFKIRYIDRVRVKGKNRPIKIFEVYDADSEDTIEKKDATRDDLADAINKFYERDPKYALDLLKKCKSIFPDDPVIRFHHDRCKKMIPKLMEPEEEWEDATEPKF
jgi:class 3 adenylate cyclase